MATVFSENLRYYRSLTGMTQEEFAQRMQITRGSVANYETGRSEPNFDLLCRAASVLGVGLDDLITPLAKKPNYVRSVQVTDDEWALLQAYRDAESTYQNVAFDVLKAHRRRLEG